MKYDLLREELLKTYFLTVKNIVNSVKLQNLFRNVYPIVEFTAAKTLFFISAMDFLCFDHIFFAYCLGLLHCMSRNGLPDVQSSLGSMYIVHHLQLDNIRLDREEVI